MKKHIFHFVLTNKLKKNIKKLSKRMRLSISKTVIHIIEQSLPVLEKYQASLKENESISKYSNIYWDSHLYIFFEEDMFRKLRHISDTVFAFSIGIIIRKLLNLYFEKIKKYKKISYNKVLTRYKNIYLSNAVKKINTQQLCYYRLSYGKNFKLIGIDYNLLC